MYVVFLDVDGVLNSYPYNERQEINGEHNEISDYHLQRLAEIVKPFNAKIVLSSTWKTLRDFDNPDAKKMWNYLVDSLARYNMEIYDITPTVKGKRPLEIKTWLESQENCREIHWVSIEDDFSEKEYEKYGILDHYVRTVYFCYKEEEGGLQPYHVQKAIEILKS